MPRIHVCSLALLSQTVAETGASHIATLINGTTDVPRPPTVAPENHLFLGFNDIVVPQDGMVPPSAGHVEQLIAFVHSWDRQRPLVIHCYAGVSRSTAGAFISLAALKPALDEAELAREIRRRSPSATPNSRMVAYADAILQRNGRMIEAIEEIGRGRDTYEGDPFHIEVG